MNLNALLRHVSENQTAGFILVLARVSPLFLLAPIFSSKMVPVRARGVAAVAIALGMAPLALHGQKIPMDIDGLGGLIVKELVVGLAYAFAVAAVFAAVSVAGGMIDTFVGFSFGSLVDPLSGNQAQVISQVYSMVGLMVFIAIGGDSFMLEGLGRTYQLVPILKYPALGQLVGGAVHAFANIFTAALELAAPLIVAMLITDAAFGLVARVAPQMNIFAVGFPAKIAVAFLVLGVSLPFAGGFIANSLQDGVGGAIGSLKAAF
ncbi:MAG: flagellar biosynthetic protein FliR [Thermoleophilaceae bacterium]